MSWRRPLGITNGALTSHIRKLEQAGLVQVLTEQGSHGNEKRCRAAVDKILVDIRGSEKDSGKNIYTAEVKIGHYSDYQVFPTCGLATVREVIGQMDDPRYFNFPKRVDAGILWFTRGYVEYRIPNELPAGMKMDRLALSVELSSEAPGVNNNWPSDISFFLNDVRLGSWMSPGDFGDVHGIFTPDWWMASLNQYGLLKRIEISDRGTFVDGLKISDVTMEQLNLDYKSPIRFRFQVEDDAENVGGLTLFGKGFGNYNQDMGSADFLQSGCKIEIKKRRSNYGKTGNSCRKQGKQNQQRNLWTFFRAPWTVYLRRHVCGRGFSPFPM